jgi:hypothetical protein
MFGGRITFNLLNHLLFVFLIVFTLWFSALNDVGLKYSLVKKGTTSNYPNKLVSGCRRNIVELTTPDSWLCCDEHKYSDFWVCLAAFDTITRTMSSTLAWILPLTPFALTLLVDILVTKLNKVSPGSQSIGINRLLFNVILIVFRSVSISLFFPPFYEKINDLIFYFHLFLPNSLFYIYFLTNWINF